MARAEAEAKRLYRAAKEKEPFDRYIADAYTAMLAGKGNGRAKRPELVVLVSHSVIKRGWSDVKSGEVCKIPGVGPVAPGVARDIAKDAFLNGVSYDGKDLRQIKRWTRYIPIEVAMALELGSPPGFDGVVCSNCGNRFHTEFDHIQPYTGGGPTSLENFDTHCWPCHVQKSERDREAGLVRSGPSKRAPIKNKPSKNKVPSSAGPAKKKPAGVGASPKAGGSDGRRSRASAAVA